MAFTITINVANDALQAEGRDAFVAKYGWEGATVPDPANPGQTIANPRGNTKQKFLEYILKDFYKQVIKSHRNDVAQAAVVVAPVGD